ncbi:MAG: glycosyltransferase family 9 protein [Planctomycetota bacterium]|nr:glycosyltransferase family 9 protein [Planctomycetota bacterium]
MTQAPRDLLIVMPSWVGDIVMATPALRALAQGLPDTTISATIRPGLTAILDGAPWLQELTTASLRGSLGPWKDARRLARHEPEAVLLLPNSLRSGLFARLMGCSRRIGFAGQGRGLLLTDAIPRPRTNHPTTTLEDYVTLVEQGFGLTVEDRRPQLWTTRDQEEEAERILAGIEGPTIVFNPGANRVDKRWHAGHFARLADELRSRYPHTILLNGSPAEQPILEQIERSAAPGLINLPARGGSLGALKAILRRSDLLVTNDTGPRHLAAAFGTPSVVLFGPTDRRFTILPGVRERHLVAEPFLTEDRVADDHPAACRIDRISVGDVTHAVDVLLAEEGTGR